LKPSAVGQAGQAEAWVDGASRGNPGEAGFGLLFRFGERADEICGFLGETTNNVAEYIGLIAALTLAAREQVDRLTVYSDSQLLVRQMQGQYRVKAPHLKPIYLRALRLRQQIARFEIRHVPREDNRDADRLANQAIDLRTVPPEWLEIEAPTA
jgi:ribonuclease HI